MEQALKPVDLYDVARMCTQSYRSQPAIVGWHHVGAAEMRLTDSNLFAVPYVNRSAVAWYRGALGSRKAQVAVVLKSDSDTITSRNRLDDHEIAQDVVKVVRPVVAKVIQWAERRGIHQVIIAGHHIGALIACEIAETLQMSQDTRVTVVTFGSRAHHKGPKGVKFLEVLRDPRLEQVGGEHLVEVARPDEYLLDIRNMYEQGDLNSLLETTDTHTVITLSATAAGRV